MKPKILQSALALLIGFFMFGCNGDSAPKITIKAIDCPANSIILTGSATKSGTQPNYRLVVKVNVKCGTANVPNAELFIEGAFGKEKHVTDQNGNIQVNKGPFAGEQSGQKVKVTIEGSDGSKETEYTVP